MLQKCKCNRIRYNNLYRVEASKRAPANKGILKRKFSSSDIKAMYQTSLKARDFSRELFTGMRTQDIRTRIIAYCRVLSASQKPDLANQLEILKEYCLKSGLLNVEFISEIGGGLNFEREKFLEIMDAVERHEVKMLIIAHKDRLARFGFEYFRHFTSKHNCELAGQNPE